MVQITLRIENANGEVLAEAKDQQGVELCYRGEYAEGDRIVLETSEHNIHVVWQVDDALGCAMNYVTKNIVYQIPFGEKKNVYSPKTFSGQKHYLYARVADEDETKMYRNLAVNVNDQHADTGCYPHASANVETRGESVFAAKNAIDGIHANHSHGNWPYASWGINRDPKAEIKVDFGRPVSIDCVKIYLRADFPHDSYWTEGTVTFSDGSSEVLHFKKTDKGQTFHIQPRTAQWLTFGTLIKAEDESPFPALTQIEVYGKDL